LKDPSVDFGIAAAIISSHLDLILPADTVFIGELGLSGQIRPVPYLELRMKEIAKMGYQRVIIPKQGKLPEVPNLAVIEIQTVDELLELIREG
jgi:DNA repair protein RadA/Sms